MWQIIFLTGASLFLAGFLFLIFSFKVIFSGFLLSFAVLALAALLSYFLFGLVTTAIFMIYLAMFTLAGNLFYLISGKTLPHKSVLIIFTLLSLIYITYGYINAYHVQRTSYEIKTEKTVEPLRIAHIADIHLGTTFNAEGFKKHLETIEKENPDLLLITGDFIDDSADLQDTVKAIEYLKDFKATYGVYFVFGNHDKGYYSDKGRTLVKAMQDNGIAILEDEIVEITPDFYLIGRKDASAKDRSDIRELSEKLDHDRYLIVMDHQPNDYEKEAEAKADLVLSGHTHGGQFAPLNKAGEWIKANDFTYGHLRKDTTDFIVTSGISAWEIRLKTGCISEYVIIDIHKS